jgi:lipopolysaccharide transport system permease protein
LGAAWTVLNPLTQIVIYTLIFSEVMRTRLPNSTGEFAFSIYLCSGVLTWGLFAEIISRSTSIFVESGTLLKKLNFPRICLPMIVLGSAWLNFGIIFSLFLGFLALTGNFPGWSIIAMVPVLLLETLFAVSIGISLGVLNVFFRDVTQLTSIVLQFWFWLTPIVYTQSILPENVVALVNMNPMATFVSSYQSIIMHGTLPAWSSFTPLIIATVVLCIFGILLFRARVGEMVDEL